IYRDPGSALVRGDAEFTRIMGNRPLPPYYYAYYYFGEAQWRYLMEEMPVIPHAGRRTIATIIERVLPILCSRCGLSPAHKQDGLCRACQKREEEEA
ncbi:MAG TPA: hypothetical protein VNV63_06755, partial [Nitrospiria bacterium]|nr:hypothetical protein [Nitrospiria bacterium]